MRRIGPCDLRPIGDPYRCLVHSVIFQQLAGSAARAIDTRFRENYGGRYPKPADLISTPTGEFRKAGLSRQKIAALRAVADAFDSRSLDNRHLRRMSDEEVIEAVTTVRGIGEWTAHMLLMFGLGRIDVLPVGDYGVRKGMRVLYALSDLPTRSHLESLAEPWRPYRSVASWYLWRVADGA